MPLAKVNRPEETLAGHWPGGLLAAQPVERQDIMPVIEPFPSGI
jgi:hypothetical protein